MPDVPPELLDRELDRVAGVVAGLRAHPVDLLSVKSLGPDVDALLIARNISKLSPFVSTQIENIAIKVLSDVPSADGLDWVRQDPGFPDAGLRYLGVPTGHGIEAKAWYVCGTEITARFRASQVLLKDRRVYLLLVAWIMSKVLFGQPTVLDFLLVDAGDVARVRDEHYHAPPNYLVIEPQDTTTRAANLQQANVMGFIVQTREESVLQPMRVLIDRHEPPYTDWSRSISHVLRQNLPYREETNFGKIDRIAHPEIEAFKARVLATNYLGRTVTQWAALLRDLASTDPGRQAAALEAIRPLYL